MKLLAEKELTWSDVVANNRMNRKRNSSGINSYEKEIGFKPEDFIAERLDKNEEVRWMDLCCGEARALIQCAEYFKDQKPVGNIYLEGIDLVDAFAAIPRDIKCIHLGTGSLTEWSPEHRYDLITCIHGLHYTGDKLKALKTIVAALKDDGLFIGNFDAGSISVEGAGKDVLRSFFKKNNILYNHRKKMIQRKGPLDIDYNMDYLGADDKAGPNYTGQPVVNSYYRIIK